jgi:ribosomal protein S18 acetylase RimI-like enzyme
MRFARGYTRRANSVNPLRRGRLPLDEKLAACERAYRAEGLELVFRIPSVAEESELDAALAARGYAKADKTSVRLLDLAAFDDDAADPALAVPLSEGWLAALARFNAMTDDQKAAHRAILGALAAPARFAAVEEGGAIASVAFAVLQDGFVCLNSIATDATKRRRGHARQAIGALLAWAKQHGAAYAYLPVVKTNLPGLALYNRLGFRTELYRYHYRSRPSSL